MAEGLLRHYAGDIFAVESAGVNPGAVRPEAIEVMKELAIDISEHRSKSVAEFIGKDFNYVITVCDNARETCPLFPGKARHIHQSFDDPPPIGAGDYNSRMEVFRRVRDEIREWLKIFVREAESDRAHRSPPR
jgi:arsenate reductase